MVISPEECHGIAVLDPFAFVMADEGRPGCLPHHWAATSDSVAARAAVVAQAELVLLKSVTIPDDGDWFTAATAGYVDKVFPSFVANAELNVRSVNLRAFPSNI